jgi:hypothetical protein
MIKKIRINLFILIIFFSILILIIPNIYAINIQIDNESYNIKKVDDVQILGFQIDQYQDNEGGFNMILGSFSIAQSFKPNLTPLVKVDLFGYSIDDGNPLEVSIREYVNMEDLTSVIIPSEEIPDQLSWFECDFPDIEVQPEKTYYLIINQISDGKFIWYGNYQHDFYPRGYTYSNQENTQTWVNLSEIFQDLDFCFKTYSYGNNQPPNLPIINGSISGKIGETYDYDFYSIDPENDEVLYRINWGNGINSQWFGPYTSGEIVIFSHKWEEKGDFIIKVQSKDIYGDKSEWSTLEISMVKNKVLYNNFQNHNILKFVSNFILFLKDIY